MLKAFTAMRRKARTLMSRIRSDLVFVAIVSLLSWTTAHQIGAQSSGRKSLHAFLATGKGGTRTTTFSADVPVIYVFWKGAGLRVGDTVSAIWLAEDVGNLSPKDTEIRRAELRVYKPEDEQSAFSLSRPVSNTWPIGKYRVELFINGSIAEVAKFTIKPGVTIETR
jgi:hypothetical protein